MSREIKYRAWNNTKNEWLNENDAELLTIHLDGTYEIDRGWVVEYPDLTLEQYTGYKDLNGKEICEGDIVSEYIEVGDVNIDGEYRHQVVWDEETLCFRVYSIYGYNDKDLWKINLSRIVIGNIHENPDLLNT